jgi:hypothetical protein
MQLTYRQFWWKWILHNAVGDIFGMALAASVAVSYHFLAASPENFIDGTIYVSVMLLSAVLQGAVLGTMQWLVLKIKYSTLILSEWLVGTIAAMLLCWSLGILPSLLYKPAQVNKTAVENIVQQENVVSDSLKQVVEANPSENLYVEEVSLWWLIVLAIIAGAFVGFISGFFQWLTLRKHSIGAANWIAANVLARTVAMIWIFLAATLPDAKTPIPLVVGMGAAGAILSGLSFAVISGWFITFMPVMNESESETERDENPEEEVEQT